MWRKRLRSASPFILTVCISVALTLLLQAALPINFQRRIPAASPPDEVSGAALRYPGTSAQPAPAAGITTTLTHTLPISQQLHNLQRETDSLWSAYYLARAASQLADAEAALRVNDLNEVEQILITVDASLDRAYDQSAEQEKGPINEFRMQVGKIHADLRVRPEGSDQKLRRLRQSMLSLVDEDG
jgi:hypothetical protein